MEGGERDNCHYLIIVGRFLEVLQYQANPWRAQSKPLTSRLFAKISLISKYPNGARIRY